MDNLALKTSNATDSAAGGLPTRKKDTSLEALANTFRQLVTTTGGSFDTGLNAISQQAGISSVAKPTDNGPTPDDYHDTSADTNDRAPVDRGSNRDETRNDVSGREPRDDSAPRRDDGHSSDSRDSHSAGNRNDDGGANSRGDESASNDHDNADTSAGSDNRSDQNASGSDDGDTDATSQKSANSETAASSETAAANGGANAQQAAVAAASAGLNVGNSIAGAAVKTNVATKGEQGQAAQNVVQTGPETSSASKIATGQSANANTHAGPQSGNVGGANQAQGQVQADANAKSGNGAQQQAQQIAKSLNPNDKVQINVKTTSDADTLVSKPSSTLTTGTVLAAADGKSNGQTAQQTNTAQSANGQNQAATANAQSAQAAQNQNQSQQNNNQNNQSQSQLQAAGGAKSAAGQASHAGATLHAGGAESASGTAGPTSAAGSPLSQQAQQTQQAQADNMTKEAPKGSSVADQVSVKITKALQAGNDRISIQLKPSELGRVDVKMELTQDGRVMAVVTAESKDTLDLLRRDSAELQRAMQEAGLQLDSGDLSFNMRGEEGEMMADGENAGGSGAGDDGLTDADLDDLILAQNTDIISDSRIDVQA